MTKKKCTDNTDVEVIKTKPRRSSHFGDASLTTEPGDTAKYLQVNMTLFNLPHIDMNDAEAVQVRLNEYFALYADNDMKPTVAGMGIALNGMHRRTLWAIVNDQPTGGAGYKTALPLATANAIKRAYLLLENLWENYMQNGKINPVSGIFLGKNNYGYQDKTEYVVTPNTQQEDYNPDSIRERYLRDFSDSDDFSDPE